MSQVWFGEWTPPLPSSLRSSLSRETPHSLSFSFSLVLLLLKCLGVCYWRPHLWGLEEGWHPLLFLSSKLSVLSFCQERRISLSLSLFLVQNGEKLDGWLCSPVGNTALPCLSIRAQAGWLDIMPNSKTNMIDIWSFSPSARGILNFLGTW